MSSIPLRERNRRPPKHCRQWLRLRCLFHPRGTSMCIDCHHVFSGSYTDSDSNGIHERHPTYDSERISTNSIAQGATRGTTDPTHWQNGTGAGFTNTPRIRFVTNGATDFSASKVIDPSKNGVFCLSCHKAHGSQYAFSLTWNPAGRTTADGCEQCHNKTSQQQVGKLPFSNF